jgi:hypothetical protein
VGGLQVGRLVYTLRVKVEALAPPSGAAVASPRRGRDTTDSAPDGLVPVSSSPGEQFVALVPPESHRATCITTNRLLKIQGCLRSSDGRRMA